MFGLGCQLLGYRCHNNPTSTTLTLPDNRMLLGCWVLESLDCCWWVLGDLGFGWLVVGLGFLVLWLLGYPSLSPSPSLRVCGLSVSVFVCMLCLCVVCVLCVLFACFVCVRIECGLCV